MVLLDFADLLKSEEIARVQLENGPGVPLPHLGGVLQGRQPGFLDDIDGQGHFPLDYQIHLILVLHFKCLQVLFLPDHLLVDILILFLFIFNADDRCRASFTVPDAAFELGQRGWALLLPQFLPQLLVLLVYDVFVPHVLFRIEIVHVLKFTEQHLNTLFLLVAV